MKVVTKHQLNVFKANEDFLKKGKPISIICEKYNVKIKLVEVESNTIMKKYKIIFY